MFRLGGGVANQAKRAIKQKSGECLEQPKALFSFYHNFHQPVHYYVNGTKFTQDHNIVEYTKQVQAFITKRWMCKREIPPKVSIMEDMGDSYKHIYYQ